MVDLIRGRHWRRLVSGLVFGFVVVGLGVTPALAGPAPFNATFQETTTFRACPAGLPPDAICFTGTGTAVGPVIPPGDPNARETFAGFVDVHSATATSPCPVDRNVVSISTFAGTLFLTTTGHVCGAVDDGTWQALGGTGIFEGATGTGTVHSVSAPPTGGPVSSLSTYQGTLNLNNNN